MITGQRSVARDWTDLEAERRLKAMVFWSADFCEDHPLIRYHSLCHRDDLVQNFTTRMFFLGLGNIPSLDTYPSTSIGALHDSLYSRSGWVRVAEWSGRGDQEPYEHLGAVGSGILLNKQRLRQTRGAPQ